MKSVSIIIPTWNGRDLLAENLPSVIAAGERYRANSNAEVEIMIVDDGGTDSSLEWLKSAYEDHKLVRVVALRENVGFLRAVNKGFAAARNEVVFLLNNDVRVEPDCIQPLVRHFADPLIFAVGGRAGRMGSDRLDGAGKIGRFVFGYWRVFLNYEAIPSEATGELISFYGSGGYTAYDRSKWDQIGGFQDCLAPNYWEDVEICYRAWKRGWKVLYEPNARVAHKGTATLGKLQTRQKLQIISERNRLLMIWINLHDPRMLAAHIFWLLLNALGFAVTLKWNWVRAFGLALLKLPEVRAQRRTERKAAKITDRDLALKFRQIAHQSGVYVVENETAEIAFNEMLEKPGTT